MMASRVPAEDTISLNTYREHNDFEAIENEADVAPLLDAVSGDYDRLRIHLYTRGDYAATAGTSNGILPEDFDRGNFKHSWHQLYRGEDPNLCWKPFFAGFRGNVIMGTTLLVTTMGHLWASIMISRAGFWATYLPPCLAILLAYICNMFVADNLRMNSYRLFSNSPKLNKRLYRFKGIIVLLVCPMMSHPIMPGYYLTNDKHWTPWWNHQFVSLTGHSSWQEALPNFGSRLPSLTRRYEDNYTGIYRPETWKASPDIWAMQPRSTFENHLPLFNPSEKFDPLQALKEVPDVWNTVSKPGQVSKPMPGIWNDFFGLDGPEYPFGEAVLLPVMPTSNSMAGVVSQAFFTTLEVLEMSLDCTILYRSDHVQWTINEDGNVHFTMTDIYGCGAEVELRGDEITQPTQNMLREYLSAMQSTLKKKFQEPPFGLPGDIDFYKVLENIRSSFANGNSTTIYRPQWVAATSVNDSISYLDCHGRHFVALLDPPFAGKTFEKSMLGNVKIQSCRPQYRTGEIKTRLLPSSPGRDKGVLRIEESVAYDFIYLDEHKRKIRLPKWNNLSPKISHMIDDFWANRIGSLQILDDMWPLDILKYYYIYIRVQHALNLTDRANFSMYIYTSKLLCSSFSSLMSTAAGLALEESLHAQLTYPKHIVKEATPETTYYRKSAFQFSFVFMSIFYSSVLIAFMTISSGKGKDLKGMPWDIASIACKAALISRSRLSGPLSHHSAAPKDIKTQRDLRIGLFADRDDHETYHWRLDSLCNQIAVGSSQGSPFDTIEHNRREVPFVVSRWAVMAFFAAVAIPMMFTLLLIFREGSRGVNPALFTTKPTFSMYPPLFGTHDSLIPSSPVAIVLWMLPLVAAFVLICWWLDGVQNFYRTRQPWVELRKPAVAHLTLTMDYNTWFATVMSLRNRHWQIFILSIASVVSLALPFLVAGLYRWEWVMQPMDSISVPRQSSWTPRSMSSSDSINVAVANAMLGMISPQTLPLWVTEDYALQPADLSSVPDQGGKSRGSPEMAGSWQIESQFLRAELSCQSINVKAQMNPMTTENPTPGILLESLTISYSLPDGTDSLLVLQHPCRSLKNSVASSSAPKLGNAVCGQWHLLNNPNYSPQWIVTIVHGQIIESPERDERIFATAPSVIALSCTPQHFRGSGTVFLTSAVTHHIQDAVVKKCVPHEENEISDNSGRDFSQMLNTSMHQANQTNGGVLFDGPIITTDLFTGDLLSYILYRYWILRSKSSPSPLLLQNQVSKIFSTIFATFIHTSGVMDDNIRDNIDLIPTRWTERIFINWVVLCILGALLSSYIVLALTLGIPHKRYLFPVNVDTLEGALYLLYPSSIPALLQRIQNPENLSLNAFHKQVENLSLIYRLGTLLDDTRQRFWVDTEDWFGAVEEEESPQEEPYRDDPSPEEENDSSSSSSTSSSPTSRSPHRSRSPSPPGSSHNSDSNSLASQGDTSVHEQEEASEGEEGNHPTNEVSSNRDRLEVDKPRKLAIQFNESFSSPSGPAPRHIFLPSDFPSVAHLPDPHKLQHVPNISTKPPDPSETKKPEDRILKPGVAESDLLNDDARQETADLNSKQSMNSVLDGNGNGEFEREEEGVDVDEELESYALYKEVDEAMVGNTELKMSNAAGKEKDTTSRPILRKGDAQDAEFENEEEDVDVDVESVGYAPHQDVDETMVGNTRLELPSAKGKEKATTSRPSLRTDNSQDAELGNTKGAPHI